MHEHTTKGLMCGTIDKDKVEQIGLKGTYDGGLHRIIVIATCVVSAVNEQHT